jgi:hypothetical protein
LTAVTALCELIPLGLSSKTTPSIRCAITIN